MDIRIDLSRMDSTISSKFASFFLVLAAITYARADGQLVANGAIKPTVKIYPETLQVVITTSESSNRVFSCQGVNDNSDMFTEIKWAGPNKSNNFNELKMRHKIIEEKESTDLQFINPTSDDSGTYTCLALYSATDIVNASIQIKIVEPVVIKNCQDRQFLIKGSKDGKISCGLSADQPQLKIFKNNISIPNARYAWDNDYSITIKGEVNDSDEGLYSLRLKSLTSGQQLIQNITVEVHSKPEIAPYNGTESDREYSGVEGQSIDLQCKVWGKPQPLVYWLDPHLRNLTQRGGYQVIPEKGILRILKLNRVDDRGQFQCHAYNTIGSTNRTVGMAVDVRPTITSFHNVTTREGLEATFECRATGDPKPTFTIRQAGENQTPFQPGDNYFRDASTEPEGGGSDVYVHRLKVITNRSHFGQFFCNASNRAGSAEQVNQLYVEFKPDLTATPEVQPQIRNKIPTLVCYVDAWPRPSITFYDDKMQMVNGNVNIKATGTKHWFTTEIPAQSIFSKFSCHAKNLHGEASKAIQPRYITAPGPVRVDVLETSPTTAKLLLQVVDDGGSRIKQFTYSFLGTNLDIHNPTILDKTHSTDRDLSFPTALDPTTTHTIRNLKPYFRYSVKIRAHNDVDVGDVTEVPLETQKASKPTPPIIIMGDSTIIPLHHATSGIYSEYRNGFLLKWSPPELDNGDPVISYIVNYTKISTDAFGSTSEVESPRVLEHRSLNDLSMRLGPLEPNQRYRIQVQAVNKLGVSLPSYIIIGTKEDRPNMPEFEPITWTKEPVTYIVFIVLAIIILILLDLVCCFSFQLGLSYKIRTWCCPVDTANSVLSDKPPKSA